MPRSRTAGPRREAHDWEHGWKDVPSGKIYPYDHGLPFEVAQDRLVRSWRCRRCGASESSSRRPSVYKKVYAGMKNLLCDEYVTWQVMES